MYEFRNFELPDVEKKSIVDFGKSIKYSTNERNKKDYLEVYVFTVCEAHE